MKLTRITGWEGRLAEYLRRNNSRKFDRGMFDCVRFTADAVFEIVGVDLADAFRDKYRTDEEAKKLVQELGEDGFFRVVNDVAIQAGFVPTDWKHAHRGDPVFITSIGDAWSGGLALCMGAHALSPTKTGIVQVPMRFARIVWSIPFNA